MNEVKIYDYDITQENELWLIRIPELSLATQAEHLRDTDRMAKSIVSLHLNVSPESVMVKRSNVIGMQQGVAEAVKAAVEARGRWNEAQDIAVAETLRAVHQLRESGVSLRDTGYLLGLSHQRVAQLLNEEVNTVNSRRLLESLSQAQSGRREEHELS